MKWIFWASAGMIAYTYLGYLGWLWVRARLSGRPVNRIPHTPELSVCMVVRNEEQNLGKKGTLGGQLCEVLEHLLIEIVERLLHQRARVPT